MTPLRFRPLSSTSDVIVYCLCSLFLVACSPEVTKSVVDGFIDSFGDLITIPETDETPPAVTLRVPDLGSGEIILTPDSGFVDFDIPPSQFPFFVVGVAEDPQGVQEIAIVGEGRINCTNDDGIGQITIFHILTADTDDSTPGEKGFTRRWLPYWVDLSQFPCGADFRRTSVSLTLHARGKNFSDMAQTTGGAVFSSSP